MQNVNQSEVLTQGDFMAENLHLTGEFSPLYANTKVYAFADIRWS